MDAEQRFPKICPEYDFRDCRVSQQILPSIFHLILPKRFQEILPGIYHARQNGQKIFPKIFPDYFVVHLFAII